MFASATMGDKSHNDDFSMCSLDNVTRVLDAVLTERHGKVNCFQSECVRCFLIVKRCFRISAGVMDCG